MRFKTNYTSVLPHIVPHGATFFITFRLYDSLPQNIVRELRKEYEANIKCLKNQKLPNLPQKIYAERKRYFGRFDKQLDENPYGNCWFNRNDIADLLRDKFHEFDDKYYELQAYTIMPNHVHLVINTITQFLTADNLVLNSPPDNFVPLSKILGLIKGAVSYKANRILDAEKLRLDDAPFFMKDSYDHFIRNEKEWENIIRYVLNNPVKAGLVTSQEDWEYNYYKYSY